MLNTEILSAQTMSETTFNSIRELGSGGFGKTSLVEVGGKRYVLKQLKQSAIADHGSTAIELFIKESEYLQKLGTHPQIPAYVSSGTNEDGPWILQQYIPGVNLSQTLAQDGPLGEKEVVKLLRSLLPVLAFIHENQAIHRDIKPANIIFADNEYHLVDFGASKKISETVLAKTGTTIGSAGYAAPEQTMGRAIYASDIYSLGVTCLNLLTNADPFILMNSASDEWDWRSFLPLPVSEGFGLILDKMITRGTRKRYQCAQEVIEALECIDRRTIARQRVKAIGKIRKGNAIRACGNRLAASAGAIVLLLATIKGGQMAISGIGSGLSHLSQPVEQVFSLSKCNASQFMRNFLPQREFQELSPILCAPFAMVKSLLFVIVIIFVPLSVVKALMGGRDFAPYLFLSMGLMGFLFLTIILL
jgi:serine/threonine protein kinase